MRRLRDYSLITNNTFGIDAKAKEFIEYDSVAELEAVISELRDRTVLHIGGGSNLLFTGDFDGVVLHSNIQEIEVTHNGRSHVDLRVGGGFVWDELVAFAVANGWSGVENLSLIPGEVGAAAVQNIGAYGCEAKDVIVSVETVDLTDGSHRTLKNEECGYAYRQSVFKNELKGCYAVTYVNIRLSKQFQPNTAYGNIRQALEGKEVTPQTVRQAIIDIRNQKLPDPKQLGNAGSFFMNPVVSHETFERLKSAYPDMPFYDVPNGVKIPAGWLIDQAGWKGKALGRAAVHDKQALVLVNLGGATASEIVRLSETIQADVQRKFGVSIKPEVNFVGGSEKQAGLNL